MLLTAVIKSDDCLLLTAGQDDTLVIGRRTMYTKSVCVFLLFVEGK